MTHTKLIVWDWNGTLWQDTEQWLVAAKAAYAHAELSDTQLTSENIRTHFDVPVQDTVYRLGARKDLPEENHRRLLEAFKATINDPTYKHLAVPRAFARECVAQIYDHGIAQKIVSNHPTDKLQTEVSEAGLSSYFKTVCGNVDQDQIYRKASKKERIQGHMEDLGAAPQETVIIADTREETRIAKDLGLTSIAITGGYNTRKVLQQVNPDHIIDDLRQVPEILGL